MSIATLFFFLFLALSLLVLVLPSVAFAHEFRTGVRRRHHSASGFISLVISSGYFVSRSFSCVLVRYGYFTDNFHMSVSTCLLIM